MKNFNLEKQQNPDKFMVKVVTTLGTKWFRNIKDAKETYPELNPVQNGKVFTWGMFDGYVGGKPVMRFEDWNTNKVLSV